MPKPSRQTQADLVLLFVSLNWGFTFLLSKAALNQVGPLTYNTLRLTLGALSLCLLFGGRIRRAPRAHILTGLAIGSLLFASFTFQATGLQQTTVAKTSFITGLYVVLVPALTVLLVRGAARPNRLVWLGVILAVIGLAVLTLEGDLSIALGDFWVLVAAFGWALQIIAIDRFAPGLDAAVLTSTQMISAALLSIPFAADLERPQLSTIPVQVWGIALFMGVIGIAATVGLQAIFKPRTTSTHAALIFSLESVFGALAGILVNGEAVTLRLILGCSLILAGMVVVEVRGGG